MLAHTIPTFLHGTRHFLFILQMNSQHIHALKPKAHTNKIDVTFGSILIQSKYKTTKGSFEMGRATLD